MKDDIQSYIVVINGLEADNERLKKENEELLRYNDEVITARELWHDSSNSWRDKAREILIELGNTGIEGSLIPNDYYSKKVDQALNQLEELYKSNVEIVQKAKKV